MNSSNPLKNKSRCFGEQKKLNLLCKNNIPLYRKNIKMQYILKICYYVNFSLQVYLYNHSQTYAMMPERWNISDDRYAM